MIYKIKGTKVLEEILVLKRVVEMEAGRYQKSGDYSVTDLINPPRTVHLKNRHKDEIKPQLANAVGSLFGTAVHDFFEKYLQMWIDHYEYKHYALEQQVKHEFDIRIGDEYFTRTVSGRYDIREKKDLFDLKNIKTWKLIFDPTFEEFHEQQNLYSYLLHLDGIDLETINIIALYKDWMEGTALRDRNYPQQQMIQYELTHWNRQEQSKLLHDRLSALIATEDTPDDNLPICSRDDRWERHPGGETIHYAILKNRLAKRATKVIKGGNLDQALGVANGMKGMSKESVVEVRFALPKRCTKYCDSAPFCNWYQDWCKKNDAGKVNEYVQFKA